jgi:creatinine amidohydrolase
MAKKKTYMLEDLTWKEAKALFEKTDIAMICVGAIHPHGSGSTLGTDQVGAVELAKRINEKCLKRGLDIVILPSIPFGYNYYHGDFHGNISIDPPTLTSYFWNVIQWLHKWGIRKVIWNTPHGGNQPMIQDAMDRARTELGMVGVKFAWDATGTALTRAGLIDQPITGGDEGLILEMSLVKAVRPDTVDFSDATFVDYEDPFKGQFKVLDPHTIEFKGAPMYMYMGTGDVTTTGGFGREENRDYSRASAEHGKKIVDGVVDWIVDFIEEYKKLEIPSKYYGIGFP